MGRLRNIGLWSLAALAVVAWIPYTYGSTSKTAIKLVKPSPTTPSQEKLPAASKRQQQMVPLSGEDDENFSGQRPSFSPFPPGFTHGAPPRYPFSEPDGPSDRYDQEEAPSTRDRDHVMGFMPEFGPPKGFPDLSKLTGGEFGKMEAPTNVGSYESAPRYSGKVRPFTQFSPQGGPQQFNDDYSDGPSDGGFGGGPAQSISQPQSAPKRRPYRSGRPSFGGGRPSGFGGPGPSGPGPYGAPQGLGGPGPYGAPDGIHGGGPGPYGGGPGLDGPSRHFGSRPSRPGGPFGGSSDGPSSRPGPFGGDGPSSRPGPFGGGPDGPSSRPGPYGSDGPPSRPSLFGESSDGPSDGPFGPGGDSSDGPSGRPGPFGPGGSSDGPGRPIFGGSSDGPSSRPGSFGGLDGPSSGSPYDSADGPSRPGPQFLSLDGPSRPGPYGGSSSRPSPFGGPPPRPGPFGAPQGGRGGPGDGPRDGPGHGPYGGGSGRHESPSAFSFQNTGPSNGPGYRLSRGYPRHHPNSVHNDDYKESADNGDFTPFNSGSSPYNYPPRHQANFGSGPEDYEQGPPPYPKYEGGSRSRRPEYSPPHYRQQQLGSSNYGSTHRFDSPKRPYVIKVSGLKSSNKARELPPGPPVFYAPSPDMKTKDGSRKFQVPH